MQYEHAGGHMLPNQYTVWCTDSNDVCKVYRK